MGKNIYTVEKNIEILLDASKEVGLELDTDRIDETKCMSTSYHQSAGQNQMYKDGKVQLFRNVNNKLRLRLQRKVQADSWECLLPFCSE
jgi:hypothetical protein